MNERYHLNDNHGTEQEQDIPDFFIAHTGQRSEKMVFGKSQPVTPFVGYSRFNFGIGVFLPSEGIFPSEGIAFTWGLVIPRLAIQSWRGMKILEQLPIIKGDSLSAAWYAGAREIKSWEQNYLDKLSEDLGPDNFQALRESVLSQYPTGDELESMIFKLEKAGINVDTGELKEEVERGEIPQGETVSKIITEYTTNTQTREKRISNEKSTIIYKAKAGLARVLRKPEPLTQLEKEEEKEWIKAMSSLGGF